MAASTDVFDRSRTAADLLRMAPDAHLRIELLRQDLSVRVGPDDPRIPLWLAAALCRSASEREAFLRFLAGHEVTPTTLTADRIEPGLAPDSPTKCESDKHKISSTADEDAQKRRRPFVRVVALAVLVLLLAGVIALAVDHRLFSSWDQTGAGEVAQNTEPSGTPTSQTSQGFPLGVDQGTADPLPSTQLDWRVVLFAILALVTPALTAAVFAFYELRRRRQARRSAAPIPQRRLALSFAHGTHGWMTGAAWREAFLQLRRHRRVVGNRLDVRASVHATVTAGGMPQLRFLNRRQSPEYLLLSERLSRRDHLAWYAGLLDKRMREEQVAVDHFEFAGDPRRLRQISAQETEPLDAVLAFHARANPMVLAESFATLAHDADAGWVGTLCEGPTPALINPRELGSWDHAEERLRAAGIASFGAHPAGLSAYAVFLNDPAAPSGTAATTQFDLPQSLARWRSVLSGSAEPPRQVVNGLIDDLEAWLGKAALDLLRSLALFPYLEPELTAHISAALAKGSTAALTETQLLRLVRLPWLRSGHMPDWLRLTLVRGLLEDRLQIATNAIQAYLLPQAAGAVRIDLEAGSDGQLRSRLREWLRLNPGSPFADRILIDALAGRQPEELGVEISRTLLERLAQLWYDRIARAAILALSATTLVAAVLALTPIDWQRDATGPAPTIFPSAQPAEPANLPDAAGTDSVAATNEASQAGAVAPVEPPRASTTRGAGSVTKDRARTGNDKAPATRPGVRRIVKTPSEPIVDGMQSPVNRASAEASQLEPLPSARTSTGERSAIAMISALPGERRTVLDIPIKQIMLSEFDRDKDGVISQSEARQISCPIWQAIGAKVSETEPVGSLQDLYLSPESSGDIGFDKKAKRAMILFERRCPTAK